MVSDPSVYLLCLKNITCNNFNIPHDKQNNLIVTLALSTHMDVLECLCILVHVYVCVHMGLCAHRGNSEQQCHSATVTFAIISSV